LDVDRVFHAADVLVCFHWQLIGSGKKYRSQSSHL
jgi:hypothetical protein